MSSQETAWHVFDQWSAAGRVDAMHSLAPAVLARRGIDGSQQLRMNDAVVHLFTCRDAGKLRFQDCKVKFHEAAESGRGETFNG